MKREVDLNSDYHRRRMAKIKEDSKVKYQKTRESNDGLPKDIIMRLKNNASYPAVCMQYVGTYNKQTWVRGLDFIEDNPDYEKL